MILRSMRCSSNVGIVSPNNSHVRLETSSVSHRRSSMQKTQLKDNQVSSEEVGSPRQEDDEQLQMKDCEVPQSSGDFSGQVVKDSLVSNE